MLIKGFLFKKALMQEHFNENYAESDKFPKATFAGSYTNAIDPAKEGTYEISVTGKLSFHGVTRTVTIPASVLVKGGTISGKASFKMVPEDYDIKIPALVRDKISGDTEVTISFDLNK
jgi:polyisoprenoid-binding protein YceI